jgi:hypothetical protein
MGGDLRYDPAAIGDYPGGGCIRKLHDADSAGAHHAKDAGMGARSNPPNTAGDEVHRHGGGRRTRLGRVACPAAFHVGLAKRVSFRLGLTTIFSIWIFSVAGTPCTRVSIK